MYNGDTTQKSKNSLAYLPYYHICMYLVVYMMGYYFIHKARFC